MPRPIILRGVYSGGEFKDLIREYAFDRMRYDSAYSRAVREKQKAKKALWKARQEAKQQQQQKVQQP